MSLTITTTVIAPAFYYPDVDYSTRYLLGSARHHGVPIHRYGASERYINWNDTHITRCLKEVRRITTSHVLFTDASDVIVLQPLGEIERRYAMLGSPEILMGVEHDGGLNAGGYMGVRDSIISALEDLALDVGISGDPQTLWRRRVVAGDLDVTRDLSSDVFHVVHQSPPDTGIGCLLHFAGGYTDHKTGKFEQMQPTWEELSYDV